MAKTKTTFIGNALAGLLILCFISTIIFSVVGILSLKLGIILSIFAFIGVSIVAILTVIMAYLLTELGDARPNF